MPGGVIEGRIVPADPPGLVAAGAVGPRVGAQVPGPPSAGTRGTVFDGARSASDAATAFAQAGAVQEDDRPVAARRPGRPAEAAAHSEKDPEPASAGGWRRH